MICSSLNRLFFILRPPVQSTRELQLQLVEISGGRSTAIADTTLEALSLEEPLLIGGVVHEEVAHVSVAGSRSWSNAIGRFGWKAQHASLLSASADALSSELGEPNFLFAGRYLKQDVITTAVTRQADSYRHLNAIVGFLQHLEPVLPDPERTIGPAAISGSRFFDDLGCAICHTRTLMTAAAGTRLQAGQYVVSKELGSKTIHPFSDFLLHDVGTGDGIVQNISRRDYMGSTAQKFRTAPLWGLRYRSLLMHDGKEITYNQAIMRHAGEASGSVNKYVALTPAEKEDLWSFLDSL